MHKKINTNNKEMLNLNNYVLTFNGDTPEALFQSLRQFCALLDSNAAPPPAKTETAVINASPQDIAPQQQLPAAITAVAPTTPIAAVSVSAPTPTPTPIPTASAPTAPAPTYDLNTLARACGTLVDAGRVAEVQSLMTMFGVQKLTALKPEQYGAFAASLRQMGVVI